MKLNKEKKKSKDSGFFPKIHIKVWSPDLKNVEVDKEYFIDRTKIILGKKRDSSGSSTDVYFVQDPIVNQEQIAEVEGIASELAYSKIVNERDLQNTLDKRGISSPDLKYLILRQIVGFKSLDPLMKDKMIENIECNGAETYITVEYIGRGRLLTNLKYSEEELQQLVTSLATMANESISRANPRVDKGNLPDGSRFAATFMSEISPSTSFTIRKHPETGWTPIGLMSKGTLIPEIAAWLWLSIEHKLPILVCGEMGSGKTSLINALCGFIRPDSRIGTIEDVPEFKLPLRPENWLRHFTRESLTSQAKPISQGELLKQMLRENIQYLVVNEIRSEDDVLPWINAISSGHGGITSFHANSFEGVLIRMNSLGIKETNLLALSGGIIFINKYGEKKNMVRRIREIGYVTQRNHEVSYEQVVTYDPKNDSYNVDVIKLINSTAGKIISSGLKEKSLEQAIAERVEYLAWLLERSKSDSSIEKPEGFLNEISKYYNNPKYFKEEIVQMDEGADRKQGLELSPRIKGIKKMEKQRPMIKGKRDVGKRVAPKAKQKRSKWKFW